jgi:hypothetical protein
MKEIMPIALKFINKIEMKKITLLIILILPLILFAQDSTRKKSSQISYTFWGYKKDGMRLNGIGLKEELYKVPAAIPYYKKASTAKILAISFGIPGSVIVLIAAKNKQAAPFLNKQTGLKITGLTLLSGSLIFLLSYSSNLKKAIRLHNDHIATIY